MTIIANVKPQPAYVKRITSADVAHGETNGAFQIWPTARPAISIEPGERLAIALRIRALAPDAGTLKLGPGAPESWKLRREAAGDYWLDIPIEAGEGSGSRTAPLVEDLGENRSREIRVQLMVTVPAENLVVTPRELDFGELTLGGVSSAIQRVGVRKIVGSFHIKALSSTLPFLKLQQSTMVDGSNYLIRITVDPTRPLKPGAYSGVVLIETVEGHRVEVSVKLKLVE
ncbi:MAG TPA: hypothetical protein VI837_12975 [Blastocatellia bacterium]|nr:hypothetical protein [Blastocatellia bacterium]